MQPNAKLIGRQQPGTEIVPLGEMRYIGNDSRLQEPFGLFYYIDITDGPSVATCYRVGQDPEFMFFPVSRRLAAYEPHILEAFKRAQQQGLIV